MMSKKYIANDITELSNQLSINDMIELINCFSDDIDVYIGTAGNHQISSEVSFACPNGHMIQINTKSCDEFENLKDWKFLTDGLKNERLN